MKLTALAALLAALALPVGVSAQEAGQQPAVTQQQPAAQSTPRIYRRWSQLLRGITLSDDQHDKIQNFLDQYAQSHPAGSPRDPQGARQLRDNIFNVLTPDQQTQFKQQMAQMRAQRLAHQQQRREQQQQNPQQNPQQYPQQYQRQYPQQYPQQQPYPQPAQTPI
ncbi:MAG: hypothetical protein JO175_08535 [Candidatus Eremiobacteraeota bacterium]|nr:hypothetical protein [Candidatus Eremiobacteraeota bacterium]